MLHHSVKGFARQLHEMYVGRFGCPLWLDTKECLAQFLNTRTTFNSIKAKANAKGGYGLIIDADGRPQYQISVSNSSNIPKIRRCMRQIFVDEHKLIAYVDEPFEIKPVLWDPHQKFETLRAYTTFTLEPPIPWLRWDNNRQAFSGRVPRKLTVFKGPLGHKLPRLHNYYILEVYIKASTIEELPKDVLFETIVRAKLDIWVHVSGEPKIRTEGPARRQIDNPDQESDGLMCRSNCASNRVGQELESRRFHDRLPHNPTKGSEEPLIFASKPECSSITDTTDDPLDFAIGPDSLVIGDHEEFAESSLSLANQCNSSNENSVEDAKKSLGLGQVSWRDSLTPRRSLIPKAMSGLRRQEKFDTVEDQVALKEAHGRRVSGKLELSIRREFQPKPYPTATCGGDSSFASSGSLDSVDLHLIGLSSTEGPRNHTASLSTLEDDTKTFGVIDAMGGSDRDEDENAQYASKDATPEILDATPLRRKRSYTIVGHDGPFNMGFGALNWPRNSVDGIKRVSEDSEEEATAPADSPGKNSNSCSSPFAESPLGMKSLKPEIVIDEVPRDCVKKLFNNENTGKKGKGKGKLGKRGNAALSPLKTITLNTQETTSASTLTKKRN